MPVVDTLAAYQSTPCDNPPKWLNPPAAAFSPLPPF
jgi:hypothetical protein